MDTGGTSQEHEEKPQERHREEAIRDPGAGDAFERDLHRGELAGQNTGPIAREAVHVETRAFDLKLLHDRLREWSDADLKRVPVLHGGTPLQQGATYADITDDDHPRIFTAEGGARVGDGQWVVPRDRIGYELWNRLTDGPRAEPRR